MPLFSKDSRLCDALILDSSLIPVVERFGIRIGVGDSSIEDICCRHNLNPEFFLAIVNTFLNQDYFPSGMVDTLEIESLVDYLSKTNDYYALEQLPNIERHFKYLMQRSAGNNNLQMIYGFFCEMKEDLTACDSADSSVWFPMILNRSRDAIYLNQSVVIDEKTVNLLPDNLGQAFNKRLDVEEKIADLQSLFVRHLKGDYDCNLCLAVVNAIFMLYKDIRQNNRIRMRLLLPAVGKLFL
ncbi:MAG: helix-turn-helix transcriptional regulator [Muribaculum sp.]|nr:helix-turn-helix transcriptional regulator [Muribaculum sp.]